MREHRIGVIDLFKQLSTTTHEGRRPINIRVLTPTNYAIETIIKEMKMPTSVSKEESIVSLSSDNPNLEIRHLESQAKFNVTTVTAYKKVSPRNR